MNFMQLMFDFFHSLYVGVSVLYDLLIIPVKIGNYDVSLLALLGGVGLVALIVYSIIKF